MDVSRYQSSRLDTLLIPLPLDFEAVESGAFEAYGTEFAKQGASNRGFAKAYSGRTVSNFRTLPSNMANPSSYPFITPCSFQLPLSGTTR